MKTKLLTAVAVVGSLCLGASADFTPFSGSIGYMTAWELNGTGDGPGAWQFADFWGVPDLKTLTSDDLTFELFPNISGYVNSLTGANIDRSFWTDSSDGGVTAGPNGNKWLAASTFRELTLGAGETVASLDFSVSAFNLDSSYTLTAYIQTLDPLAGYGVSAIDSAVISGMVGTTTLSIGSVVPLEEGHILQIGYQMAGINANQTDDWGSATATLENVSVVPEPATLGLLGIFGGAMLFFRRRFKR